MNKSQIKENENSKFLRTPAACSRYGIGRNLLRQTAEKAGAAVRIGRVFLIDVDRMDAYFSGLAK